MLQANARRIGAFRRLGLCRLADIELAAVDCVEEPADQ